MMTLEEAKKHLLANNWLEDDGSLYSLGAYISVDKDGDSITLDGSYFEPEDLIAIGVYVQALRSSQTNTNTP